MKLPAIIERMFERAGFVNKEKAAGATPNVYGGGYLDPFIFWVRSNKVSPKKAMDVLTGWVYAATRAISLDVSAIDFRLFKMANDGNDEEIFDHELLSLLNAPNDYEIGIALKYVIASHLEICGNAYIFLEGVEREGQKPVAMHILNPACVTLVRNRNQFPPKIEGYKYRLGNMTYDFQPHQVIHLKYPDPNDSLDGVGTVQSIMQWIDSDNYAMEFNRRFFLNGARVGGILKTETAYDTNQLKYIKASFEDAMVGVDKAYSLLALPKGVSYEEMGKAQKDLDFANLMTMMRDRIIAGFKVPRTAIGITDDVNRANAEATDYVFAARTIKPIMRFITEYLNEFLVPLYGEDLYLSFTDPVPEDRAQSIDEMNKSIGGQPVITANEARQKYFGLDPVDGGDALQKPFNLVDVGEQDTETEQVPPEKRLASTKRIARRKTRYSANLQRRKQISVDAAAHATQHIRDMLKQVAEVTKEGRKNLSEMSDENYEVVWKGFALRVDGYEKKLLKAVRSLNDNMRSEVHANLPEITKAIPKASILDIAKNLSALVEIASPILKTLAGNEGKEAGKLLGLTDIDILTPEVLKALDQSIKLLSKSYVDETASLLKDKLQQGLKEGQSLEQLTETVNAVFDYSDEVRARTVARTETFRIANMATEEAWKQSGVVKTKVWFTAADERVCPWCGPLHGKVISVEKVFFEKGEKVVGSDGSIYEVNYDSVSAGALHPNCRCYIRPGEISLE